MKISVTINETSALATALNLHKMKTSLAAKLCVNLYNKSCFLIDNNIFLNSVSKQTVSLNNPSETNWTVHNANPFKKSPGTTSLPKRRVSRTKPTTRSWVQGGWDNIYLLRANYASRNGQTIQEPSLWMILNLHKEQQFRHRANV